MGYSMLRLTSIVITGLSVLLASCQDKPVEPEPVKEYPVFISDVNQSKLYTYYPSTRKVDSVDIPWQTREGITVSADGKRLYLADRYKVTVINSKTYDLIAELPYQPDDWVAVSPDNRLLAIANGGLHLLSTPDYKVVFVDTIPVIHCEFSSDSKTLYCARKGTKSVYQVDLVDSTYAVTLIEAASDLLYYVVPSIDQRKLFCYVHYGLWTYGFEVYDVLLDSIVFRDVLVPGAGQIAITPDGRYAVYTNPGISGTDPPPPGTFTIYDIQANNIYDSVSTIDYVHPPCICAANTMAVTPDGKWLVTLGGIQLSQQVLYLYDLQREDLVDYVDLGRGVVLTNTSVQKVR